MCTFGWRATNSSGAGVDLDEGESDGGWYEIVQGCGRIRISEM